MDWYKIQAYVCVPKKGEVGHIDEEELTRMVAKKLTELYALGVEPDGLSITRKTRVSVENNPLPDIFERR